MAMTLRGNWTGARRALVVCGAAAAMISGAAQAAPVLVLDTLNPGASVGQAPSGGATMKPWRR